MSKLSEEEAKERLRRDGRAITALLGVSLAISTTMLVRAIVNKNQPTINHEQQK